MKYYNFLTGGIEPIHFLAAMTFGFIGWGCYKIISAIRRDKGSQRTPAKFHWGFWLKDNAKEAAQGAFLFFVFLRFAADLVPRLMPDMADWFASNDPMWLPFLIGVLKAPLLERLKKSKLNK